MTAVPTKLQQIAGEARAVSEAPRAAPWRNGCCSQPCRLSGCLHDSSMLKPGSVGLNTTKSSGLAASKTRRETLS